MNIVSWGVCIHMTTLSHVMFVYIDVMHMTTKETGMGVGKGTMVVKISAFYVN